ncbi:MAG: hypothetical protein IJW86_07520 [Clostridia bacterium]|nr:hypothetical protein [Clostridia bacterium]
MKICEICRKALRKIIIVEISKETELDICEDCMAEILLMRIAKGKRYDFDLEGWVRELKEMKSII